MAKAVAENQGWRYERHDEFFDVMNRITQLSGDSSIRDLRPWANELHGCYYKRKRFLDATDIGYGLDQIEVLLDIMEPMTRE